MRTKYGYLTEEQVDELQYRARQLRACNQMRRSMSVLGLNDNATINLVTDAEVKTIQKKNTMLCNIIKDVSNNPPDLIGVLQEIKEFI